ncbi:MAG: hypothetical protein Q9168_007206, partial [Polycauliona sp. 1 TL-2023]
MSSHEHQPTSSLSKDLLTPEVETSFFRSWALRTRNSAYSSSSDVSPGTRTPATSPIPQRTVAQRPQRREVPRRPPESHVHHLEIDMHRRDVLGQQPAFYQSTPDTVAYTAASAKSRNSGDAQNTRSSSNASSIARRAFSFVKGSASPRQSSVGQDTKSNKLAKDSLVSKRQKSGHWSAIGIGKREEPNLTLPETQGSTSHVHYGPTVSSHTASRPGKVIGHSKSKVSLRPPTHRSTDSSSPDGKAPKEGLVDRTKRILGIKSAVSLLTERDQSTRGRQRSTAETLDRTSTALKNLVELTPPSGSSTSNMSSTVSIGGRPKIRNVFRPHYHRQHTGHSSSSSVRKIMFGKPPVSTPNDECMYTGSDSQQYFRVQLTAPDAPKYLPSEARRIGTPPLPESKGRGFFFDYNPPASPPSAGRNPPSSPPSAADSSSWPTEPMDTATLQPRPYSSAKATQLLGGGLGHRTPSGLRTPGTGTRPRSPGGRLDSDGVDWFRVKVALGAADEERGG